MRELNKWWWLVPGLDRQPASISSSFPFTPNNPPSNSYIDYSRFQPSQSLVVLLGISFLLAFSLDSSPKSKAKVMPTSMRGIHVMSFASILEES